MRIFTTGLTFLCIQLAAFADQRPITDPHSTKAAPATCVNTSANQKDVVPIFSTNDTSHLRLQDIVSAKNLSIPNLKPDGSAAYIFHVTLWDTGTPANIIDSTWYAYRYDGKSDAFQVQYMPWPNGTIPKLYDTKSAVLISVQGFPKDTAKDSVAGKDPTASLSYTFAVTKQTAANMTSVTSVLGAILGTKARAEAAVAKQVVCATAYSINVTELPYDIKITATADNVDKQATGGSGSPLTQTFHAIDREWWDLGIGMVTIPLKETVVSNVNGKSTLTTVNRINPYGFFDFYAFAPLLPKNDPRAPHLQVGVPLSGQPLHRPYAGMAIPIPGLERYLGFTVCAFGGIDFMRVQYSTTESSHWVKKRVVGVELPVAQLVSKINPIKSK